MYMKKCLFIFILGIISLCSCEDQRPNDYKRAQKHIENNLKYSIHKIEFEGHSYLIYDGYSRAGICHDENCKCKN